MKTSTSLALALMGLLLVGGVVFFTNWRGDGSSSRRTTRPVAVSSVDEAPGPADPIEPAAPLTGEQRPGPPTRTERVATPSAPAPKGMPVFQTWRGTVVSSERALGSAHVILFEGERAVREAQTQGDGSFELRAPGVLEDPRLAIHARGFAQSVRHLPVARAGELRILGNLKVEPARMVTGTIRTANGGFARRAEVLVETGKSGRGKNRALLRTQTGADGEFRVPDAMPGPLWVTARLEGFGEARERFDEGETIELTLGPESMWSATVTDADGIAIFGATVELASSSGSPPRRDTTDRAGRVSFGGLNASSRPRVTVSHPEHYPQTLTSIEVGSETELQLRSLPVIKGTVVRGDRQPLPPGTQAAVVPAGVHTDSTNVGVPVSNKNGTYEIKGVKPGRWIVEARAPGFAISKSEPFVVRPEGETLAPTVTLRAGGIVKVEVQGPAGPIADATLELYASYPDERLLLEPGRPGADLPGVIGAANGSGLAILRDLPPGSWWVIARGDDHVAKIHGPLVATEGKVNEARAIELESAGKITGKITNEALVPQRATIVARFGAKELRLSTDDRGMFELANLPRGSWELSAHSLSGSSFGPRRVDVRPGEATEWNCVL